MLRSLPVRDHPRRFRWDFAGSLQGAELPPARFGVSCTPGWSFPISKGGIWSVDGGVCPRLLPLTLPPLPVPSLSRCPLVPPTVTTGPFWGFIPGRPFSAFTQPGMGDTGTRQPPAIPRGSPGIHLHSGTPKGSLRPPWGPHYWWGQGWVFGGHWTVVSLLVGACGTPEPAPCPGVTFPPGTSSQFAGGRCSQTRPAAATVRGALKPRRGGHWGGMGTQFPTLGEHSGGAPGAQDPPAPPGRASSWSRGLRGSCLPRSPPRPSPPRPSTPARPPDSRSGTCTS